MAFFDEIGKKITQTSQGMVQKTKDTAETMRLNSAITDEEKRIQELYLAIGQRYFELHADSYEPELEELVLSVKEANTKIENYAEQVKRLKGIVRCPNCNGEVVYGAPFCSHCGTKMPVVETEPVENKVRRCKQCGLPLPDGAGFCTNCGTAAEPDPAEASVRRCARCNTVLEDGVLFCTNCGTKADAPAAPAPVVAAPVAPVAAPAPVVAAPAPVVAAPAPVVADPVPVVVAPAVPVVAAPAIPVPPAVPAAPVCPNCGHVAEAGMLFCIHCGTKIAE